MVVEFFKKINKGDYKALKISLTKNQIENWMPFYFEGKEEFILFYLTFNGVYFPKGAKISTESFLDVDEDEYYELELEYIYDIEYILEIKEAIKEQSEEVKKFAETHIPFARNAGGNDFFIEIPTGKIKYVSWEYGIEDGLIEVAPSFKDFCGAIEPW